MNTSNREHCWYIWQSCHSTASTHYEMNIQAVSYAKFKRIHSFVANVFFQRNYDAMVIKQIVLAESRATERYTNGVTKVREDSEAMIP